VRRSRGGGLRSRSRRGLYSGEVKGKGRVRPFRARECVRNVRRRSSGKAKGDVWVRIRDGESGTGFERRAPKAGAPGGGGGARTLLCCLPASRILATSGRYLWPCEQFGCRCSGGGALREGLSTRLKISPEKWEARLGPGTPIPWNVGTCSCLAGVSLVWCRACLPAWLSRILQYPLVRDDGPSVYMYTIIDIHCWQCWIIVIA
jgi:hypothetical protein